jgi:hypothetical protein
MGVILGGILLRRRARQLETQGHDHSSIDKLLFAPTGETKPNWWILGGSLVFAVFTVTMGVSDVPLAQEIIFLGSMAIILFLMYRLLLELKPEQRNMLVGTAVIIFVFRAVPLPGPGAGWFEIDVLNFDQQFFSVLSLIASLLTLVGMVVLHRRCALYRDYRHRYRIAAGSDRDDPDAGLDRQERTGTFESHVFRGHGVIHQPGAFRRKPWHQVHERNLYRHARSSRPRNGRDSNHGRLQRTGLAVDYRRDDRCGGAVADRCVDPAFTAADPTVVKQPSIKFPREKLKCKT